MGKQDIELLNRARVASPCNASWDDMTGDERVRMCGQCDRKIYNIAAMSSSAAAKLLRESTERTCIRMFRRADGTVMTADCPTGLRAYRQRVGRIVSAAFAMVLGVFTVGNAQRVPSGDSRGARSESNIEMPCIEGTVTDPNGKVVPGAMVTVTTPTGKKLTAQTNKKGYFRIMHFRMLGGQNKLRIELAGFDPYRDTFTIINRELITFPAQLNSGGWVGVVTIESPPMIDTRKSSISTRIILNDN